MTSKENRPYGLLARFYDEVLPGISEMNRHARTKMLGAVLSEIESACDLACGSGGTAIDLARSGKRVFAVDNSAEFCRIVRARAREQKIPVTVVQADMRRFRLPVQVDLVTCEFAALNNLGDRRGLARVFQAVHRALRPGGRFLFDVNTPRSFREQVPQGGLWFESPRFKLVIRGTHDDHGRRARVDFEWFVPAGQLWRHVQETVLHVAWSDAEIRRALHAAGFERPMLRDGIDVRPPIPGAKRGYDAYYLAHKPSE